MRRALASASQIAKRQLKLIKDMPAIVRRMGAAVGHAKTEAHVRVTLVAQLAYLVQPHDIIPDELPAGFGYVDDAMFLRSALVDFPFAVPGIETSAEEERVAIDFLGICVPRGLVPQMRQKLAEMRWLTTYMRLMPPFSVDPITRELLKNPMREMVPPGAIPESILNEVPKLQDGTLADSLDSVRYAFEEGGGGIALKDGTLSFFS